MFTFIIITVLTVWAIVTIGICALVAGGQRNWRQERAHEIEMESGRAHNV